MLCTAALAALFIMVLCAMICFKILVLLYIKMFVWRRLAERLTRLGVRKVVQRRSSPGRRKNIDKNAKSKHQTIV